VASSTLWSAAPAQTAIARLTWTDNESSLVIQGPGGKTIVPQIGAELPAGSTIRTTSDAAELQLLPSGSRLRIAAKTTIRLDALTQGKTAGTDIYLSAGKIRMLAMKTAGMEPAYSVRTDTSVCAVRGTDFARQYDPGNKKDWLCVLEGLIEFSSRDGSQSIRVASGEFVSLAKGWRAEPAPESWLKENLADLPAFSQTAKTK
jgi:ferric-dicitrate binding protein FerR (iron transport regulator)